MKRCCCSAGEIGACAPVDAARVVASCLYSAIWLGELLLLPLLLDKPPVEGAAVDAVDDPGEPPRPGVIGDIPEPPELVRPDGVPLASTGAAAAGPGSPW